MTTSAPHRAVAPRGTRRTAVASLGAVLLLVVAGCAPADSSTTPAAQSPALLSPAEFSTAIDEGRYVLNVHTPDQGMLPGTDAAIPFDQLSSRADELPQDLTTSLAVYCLTGRMSELAVRTLVDLGYTDIVELEGGMVAWDAAFPDRASS